MASYVPWVPEVELSEDVVLFGLLPPLLYAAAQGTSLVDFNANRRPILLLSVGLVVFTTFGVGLVAHLLLPGVSWAIALAIGAVVAPPDAVAATAIGRRIGLPRRIVTILEGESLLNDATALVALGTALAVAEGSGFEPSRSASTSCSPPAAASWSGSSSSSSSPSCAGTSPTRCSTAACRWWSRSRRTSPPRRCTPPA